MTNRQRKKHPRFTYERDREGVDELWVITDHATGQDLACVRFWEKEAETEEEVVKVVNWLNAHAEAWLFSKAKAARAG